MLAVALGIASFGFALMGAVALSAPVRITSQFGITALNKDGRNEVRAVYGGFGIAVSAALAMAVGLPAWQQPAAAAVAIALSGMALGRAFSAVMDRHIGRLPLLYGAIEAGAALILLASITL